MSNHNELLASQRVLSMLESACEHSEQVLDSIPSVFVVLNRDNRIIRANRAFCELAGSTMEAMVHRDFGDFFTTENRGHLQHHFQQVRANPVADASASAKIELASTRDGQAAKPFLWRISKMGHLSQAEGQVISVMGDDLSALYQSELKLMSIFSGIPLGLMVIDCNGQVTELLSEYCNLLLGRDGLVGQSLQHMLTAGNPAARDELTATFAALRECAGKPVMHFSEIDPALSSPNHVLVRSETSAERWVRPRFQPIAKNDGIDRYLVILEDTTASHLAQRQIEQADLLGKQAQALYDCAIRDPLSELYTRLFLNDSFNPLIASAKRGNYLELAILMLDIDNFKSINDTHGHAVGDKVIKAIGRLIKSCIRDTDIPVRYGGEEFIVALPCTDSHELGGAIVAERIRAELEATPIDIGGGTLLRVTTSGGVAYCHKDDTLATLIQRSDAYLYKAKHAGKNRVCVEASNGA